ncbi:MAG: MTH938/NDUFAF3 family protein [Actinomycetota bacterium]|nr:MTH938/NDUFAF3 family protein [Actinomycetota bacterium]
MPRITDYSFGRVVVDGEEHTHDVIVLPDRVVGDWWRQDGHRLVLDDLDEVLEDLPERLIVGAGAQQRMQPDPDAVDRLQDRGHTVEVLATDEAVRRYGQLDPTTTAAALHLTC